MITSVNCRNQKKSNHPREIVRKNSAFSSSQNEVGRKQGMLNCWDRQWVILWQAMGAVEEGQERPRTPPPARAAGDRTEGGTFDAKLSVGKEGDAVAELGEVNKSPPLSCKQSLWLQKLAHLFCTIKFIEVWQEKFRRQRSRKTATAEASIWVNDTISWFSFYLSI